MGSDSQPSRVTRLALASVLVTFMAMLVDVRATGAALKIPPKSQPPTISGTAQEGSVLTAIPGRTTGMSPISFSYSWQRCDTEGGSCSAIGGASNAAYVLTTSDAGRTVRVTVTARSVEIDSSSTSAATAVVVEAEAPGISTLSIRRRWLEDAVRESAERPLFGHGVGMFRDNTPEARRMGVSGQRTYPHNTFVEAAHALGLPGLLAFTAFVGAAALALVVAARHGGLRRHRSFPFIVGVATFAFVNTNVSGEIGADALLWAAAALTVVAYAESRAGAG